MRTWWKVIQGFLYLLVPFIAQIHKWLDSRFLCAVERIYGQFTFILITIMFPKRFGVYRDSALRSGTQRVGKR